MKIYHHSSSLLALILRACKYLFPHVSMMLISLLFTGNLHAHMQNTISIHKQNISIQDVFKEIEANSNYVFYYSDKVRPKLNKKINVSLKTQTIQSVLDHVLHKNALAYSLDGYQISVFEGKSASPVTERQQRILSGKVTDEKGNPVLGVTVRVAGTSVLGFTNAEGVYSIQVPETGKAVRFTMLGFESIEKSLGEGNVIDITLKTINQTLEEVVAVGYGTVQRGDLTGAIGSIKAEDIVKSNSSTFAEAIQGKIAGVRVNMQSGEPGAGINIEIRGASSINAGSQPLYVIDGIQIDVNESEVATSNLGTNTTGNPLASINPADIESIDVLKDASAAAIYGARGANGVIIITTKSGKAGKTNITANLSHGIEQITKSIDMIGGQEYANYRYEQAPNSPGWAVDTDGDGIVDSPRDVSHLPSYNWQDELFRVGSISRFNLSMQGGSGKTTYTAALGYEDKNALVKHNNFTSLSGRARMDHQASDRLKIGTNVIWGKTLNSGIASSGGGEGQWTGIIQSIYTYRPVLIHNPANEDEPVNLLTDIEEALRETGFNRFVGNVYAEYDIRKNLKLRVQGGGTTTSSKLTEFHGSNTTPGRVPNGRAALRHTQTSTFSQATTLNYNTQVAKGHMLRAMGGFEMNTYRFETLYARGENFEDQSTGPYDMTKALITHPTQTNVYEINRMSFFGRLNYTIKNRYLFTSTLRADGSSNFGRGKRFGYFPSAAFSWRVLNEQFMKGQNTFSDLRLRLSYGMTGNDRIPPYSSLSELSPLYYASNGNLVYATAPANPRNDNLRWEGTEQFNLGVDVAILKGRISLAAEAYSKMTNGMLLNAQIEGHLGYVQQWQNIGNMENKGLEFTLNTVNVETRGFKWNTAFNIYFNRNRVASLGGTASIPVIFGAGYLTDVGIVQEGQPLGTAYGYVWDGIYQIDDFTWQNDSDPTIPHSSRDYILRDGIPTIASGATIPGVFRYKDLDGNNIINAEDRQIISNSNPKFAGGLTNEFSYRNFSLYAFLEGVYGNDIFNAFPTRVESGQGGDAYNLTRDYWENRWTPDNPSKRYASISRNNTDQYVSTYYVEDGSYLRLRTLSLAYNFQPGVLKRIGATNLKVEASVDNVHVWTNYGGLDPDVRSSNKLLPGYDRLAYPRPRTYMFGINMTF